jgi:putative acetyltransferase
MILEMLETNSKNKDFIALIKLLDEDLNKRYGELQKQYDKHNKIDYINNVIVIYKEQVPVACGAFKKYDEKSAEIKRIFVRKENRRQGLAKQIINKLEQLVSAENYKYAILETGIKQEEAINLYKNMGYGIIQNYGPYVGNINSICMKKVL